MNGVSFSEQTVIFIELPMYSYVLEIFITFNMYPLKRLALQNFKLIILSKFSKVTEISKKQLSDLL